jgi:1-acyl-sn-glycerol-3-phosphate acyltransferase
MMTSIFYDLPVLRWFMARVFHAIRVPKTTFRREVPELAQAAEVLRRGDCLVVFPEGRLRRTSEEILGTFGQGAWHILKAAPQTPVVLCWIEGGWGSFASYAGGKPMKNKRLDWWRPIDIALAEPRIVPPEVLADQQATRTYLRQACLECRRHLGLEVPAEAPAEDAAGADPHEIHPGPDGVRSQ